MPIDHSGATGSLDVRASRLNATAPTTDAANVDSSAAGATAAIVMPDPTRIGPRIDPPPMP